MTIFLISVTLIVICFTIIMIFALCNGQSLTKFILRVPKVLEIEAELAKEKADGRNIGSKKKN